MKVIQRFFWVHLLVAAGALAVGYGLEEFWPLSLGFAFLGSFWLAAQRRRWKGLEGFMLYVFILGAVVGFWVGLPGWLLLLSGVAVMGAWDLDHFLQRLYAAERVEFGSGLGRDHLRRLMMVEGIGFLIALLAITVRLNIQFWWAALLALLVVIGISRIIAYVRRETE